MKRLITFFATFCIVYALGSCEDNCKPATVLVINQYSMDLYFTIGTNQASIGSGSSKELTVWNPQISYVYWNAMWGIRQPDGSTDRYFGSGELSLRCGEYRNLTPDYDYVTHE